eukprot:578844-Pyramimonas_sp.AAC.1
MQMMWYGLLLAGVAVHGAGEARTLGANLNRQLLLDEMRMIGTPPVGTSSRWSPAWPVAAARTPGALSAASTVAPASPRRQPQQDVTLEGAQKGVANTITEAKGRKAKATVVMIDQMEHSPQAHFRTIDADKARNLAKLAQEAGDVEGAK